MDQITRHSGRWTFEDRFASAWHYLPVEVPPGCRQVRVELDYDRTAATLDLGCLGAAGFRGWSGGARRSFVISADVATPGYLPGEPEPGTWHVMIGIYRLRPEGVPYQLTATAADSAIVPGPDLRPAAPPAPASCPAGRDLPAAAGRRWLAGDLHAHTVHSDGAVTVPELARLAVEHGLDFLAVTDHNTVSHHAELAPASAMYGITLLPGQEVTTDAGHANVLGDVGWVDFRDTPDDWLAHARQRGGIMSVNHPIAGHVSWLHAMHERPPLVEVWHWSWLDQHWTTPLAWWLAWDPAAIPVGGSDWHSPGPHASLGSPTTWVECEGTGPDAVLDGLRAGRVAISAGRDGPVLLRRDGELVAVDADGTILTGPDGPCARISGALAAAPAAPGCHRLCDTTGATLALTP
jgi:PHP domain-containing protein